MLRIRLATVLLLALCAVADGQDEIFRTSHIFRPIQGTGGAVVAGERLAAEAGLEVLRRGGNAVDAAVTVGFTLAVTCPRAGNIGGGGFMLIHLADTAETHALDYRETAPAAATAGMFLDASGAPDPVLSRKSPLAVGVPGSVAGLLAAHERFATRPLEELLEPAIRLAREGLVVDRALAGDLAKAARIGRLDPTARAVFLGDDGHPPEPGDILTQPDLAASLERIAAAGRDGFYRGPTAESIVSTLAAGGGIMTLEDLAGYQPIWREPVRGTYMDHTVLSMPPPSSGGVHLIQMLRLVENLPVRDWGHNSRQYVHMLVEIMKRAYADRSRHLGDPDFSDVPTDQLLSEEYEQAVLKLLDPKLPVPSANIRPGALNPDSKSTVPNPNSPVPSSPQLPEPDQTTHFSVVDRFGNAVANTTTLNFSFGSGIMASGSGILLNNEMDDFSAKPGTPNAYGLIGGEKNAVAPGKRMLSSMTPAIVLKDGKVRIVTGSPGGSRIITTVLQVILNIIDFEMNAAEAVNAPRFHHQWLPDRLEVERGFPAEAINALRSMGYPVEISQTLGAAQTIIREPDGTLTTAGDPRRDGSFAAAY